MVSVLVTLLIDTPYRIKYTPFIAFCTDWYDSLFHYPRPIAGVFR